MLNFRLIQDMAYSQEESTAELPQPSNAHRQEDSSLPKLFIVIPARYQSTRLPAKPLALIQGVPMICLVVQRALELARLVQTLQVGQRVCVIAAIDDDRVKNSLHEHFKVPHVNAPKSELLLRFVMTSPELQSGTDRIFQALTLLPKETNAQAEWNPSPKDIVLNIQGDEPFFSLSDVKNLVEAMFNNSDLPLATLAFRKKCFSSFFQANFVKVVIDSNGDALYFSRAPIPWPREKLGAQGISWLGNMKEASTENEFSFLHHLGVYAYRFNKLSEFATELPCSSHEATEGLEQLRALQAGWKIRVLEASSAAFGIDTLEDLKAAQLFAVE